MARYIIENRINAPDNLKDFNVERYSFDAKSSTDTKWVFSRKFIPVGKK